MMNSRLRLTIPNLNLPKEILMEIFSRLPAKGVGRSRCLSKSWNTLLSTNQFIKYHLTLNNAAQNPNLHILHVSFWDIKVITLPINNGNYLSRNIDISTGVSFVLGSCNGLILTHMIFSNHIIAVNPITLQEVSIPYVGYHRAYAIGYDYCTDDYKIVAPYSYPAIRGDVDTIVDLYSMKKGIWEMGKISCKFHFPSYTLGIFFNGAIHWPCTDRESRPVIAAFDFVNETFYEIPSPVCIQNLNINRFALGNLEGCLCMVHCDPVANPDSASLWVMKEYGLAKSWTKFSLDFDPNMRIKRPILLSIVRYEQVLFLTLSSTLVSYNLKKNMASKLAVDKFVAGEIFVGSLVSPI